MQKLLNAQNGPPTTRPLLPPVDPQARDLTTTIPKGAATPTPAMSPATTPGNCCPMDPKLPERLPPHRAPRIPKGCRLLAPSPGSLGAAALWAPATPGGCRLLDPRFLGAAASPLSPAS